MSIRMEINLRNKFKFPDLCHLERGATERSENFINITIL